MLVLAAALVLAVSCARDRADTGKLVKNYALVTIPAPDLTGITDNGKEVLRLYRMAADEVDKIYWLQYFGDRMEQKYILRLLIFSPSRTISFKSWLCAHRNAYKTHFL